MVEMPFSLHFILSFVVMALSRLRFSCSTARLWHRVWKSQVLQCLFSTSAGSAATPADVIASMICRVSGRSPRF